MAALLVTGGMAVGLLLALVVPLVVGQTTRFIDDVNEGVMREQLAHLGKYVPAPYLAEFTDVLATSRCHPAWLHGPSHCPQAMRRTQIPLL